MEYCKTQSQRNGIQVLLQTIKEYGPISKRELQEKTGFSWAHVSQVSKRLLEDGYIVVDDKLTTAGRSADKLDIAGTDNYSIGIDLSSQWVLGLLTDLKGRIVECVEIHWENADQEQVLEKVFSVLDHFMARYANKHFNGIGIATQGIVDTTSGISVHIDGIEGWKDVPLKRIIEDKYEMEVILAHDPDCLMKCENSFGILKENPSQDVLLVHFNQGVGIGMSIMIHGEIYTGSHGRAGEIGDTILNIEEGTKCRLLHQYTDKTRCELRAEQLCNRIAGSVAIANSLFDPEKIILHTLGCEFRDQLYEAICTQIRENAYDLGVQICVSKLDKEAKAKGAALMMSDLAIDCIR